MIALLTALFFEILVHVLNIASAKARAKTVFGHLKLCQFVNLCALLFLLETRKIYHNHKANEEAGAMYPVINTSDI